MSVYCEAGLLPPCEVHSGDVIVWQYQGTTDDVSERCWCSLPRGRNVRKLCPRRRECNPLLCMSVARPGRSGWRRSLMRLGIDA